ncbi:N-acetyltransferase [Pseudomonas sp. CAU 1711]|uniref:GNAT family N-acetyltransferase n=1 Tax=Pseudomonas sp. CAU 1711 TaxID=3140356 RepID=UPI003260AFE3
MPLTIRPERPGDTCAIEALTIAAFRDAPHSDHTEQFIVSALRAAGALSLSLVAEEADAILGHVALSPVSISSGATGWFGLGPISVAPERQGQGIGTRLMHEALDTLRTQGAAGCVLLGDPAYYRRFGFRPEPELVLADVPAEYFQALSFGQPLPRGMVTYHQAFAAQR